MSWLAFVIGAFYLVGGLAALRQAHLNLTFDRALATIHLGAVTREDRIVGLWMLAAAGLTIVSGAVLLALSRWAVAAFALCWLAQAVYLLWAMGTRDYGRMATIQAFALYTVAAMTVAWMAQAGVLN